MVKKILWAGMLVLILAFGMAVVGCDNDNDDSWNNNSGSGFTPRQEYYHSFHNSSRHFLTVYTYKGALSLPPIGGSSTLWSYNKNISINHTNQSSVYYERYDRGDGVDYYFYDK
jgi:hypothetical protein